MEIALLSQKISRIQRYFPLSRRECEEAPEIVNGDKEQAVKLLIHLGPRFPSNQGISSTATIGIRHALRAMLVSGSSHLIIMLTLPAEILYPQSRRQLKPC